MKTKRRHQLDAGNDLWAWAEEQTARAQEGPRDVAPLGGFDAFRRASSGRLLSLLGVRRRGQGVGTSDPGAATPKTR